jgi:hypothetical protein
LARCHCLDELFEVGAAIIYVSHMVRTALRRPRESKVRRDGCRRLITLERAERSCRGQQQERRHDQNYYAHHAKALPTILCSQTRCFLVSAHYPREQSNSLVYGTHSPFIRVSGRLISPVIDLQRRTIEIDTCRMSPWETMETDWFWPTVVTLIFAENPAPSTEAVIRPPPTRPSRLPLIPRLDSLHVPEMRPPWLTRSLLRSNL